MLAQFLLSVVSYGTVLIILRLTRMSLGSLEEILIQFYFQEKRWGGSVTTSGVCKHFSDWFHNNGIHDLQFKGPRFTWSRGSLSKRLDRVVCNKAWFSKYPNASVLHLPKVESDHRPVVIRFDQYGRKSKDPKPFRFMAAWLTDSRFENFMENNWNNDISYYQPASKFTKQVQQWNKETFGNIL